MPCQTTTIASHYNLLRDIFSRTEEPIVDRGRRVFGRGGVLDAALVVTLLLYQVRFAGQRGYARMLEVFWDEAQSHGVALPQDEPVAAPSFCNARQKLPATVVREVFHLAADRFDETHGESFRFKGLRLLGVDGSKLNVQPSEQLRRAYGTPSGAHYPQLLLSTLFDLCARVPVDAVVAPNASSERQQLSPLLERTRPGSDVLVLDRGYPSFDVFGMLLVSGLDFVARVPMSQTFSGVEDFIAGGQHDSEVALWPSTKSALRNCGPIMLRAVRVARAGCNPWVLLTTLDAEEFTAADIAEIYRLRWEIEEFYNLVKGKYFGQGAFHARSARGVEQEIYAQMLLVAITRFLMASAAVEHDADYDHISQKAAILACGDYITRLLLHRSARTVTADLDRLLRRIARATERRRPGRSFPRRSRRPRRRWGPSGRCGKS